MIFETGIHELATRHESERVAIFVDETGRIMAIRHYAKGEAAETFREMWQIADGTAPIIRGWATLERNRKSTKPVDWDAQARKHAEREKQRMTWRSLDCRHGTPADDVCFACAD